MRENEALTKYIQVVKPVFTKELASFFAKKIQKYDSTQLKIYKYQLLDLQKFSSTEGKFIRPTLALLCYQLITDKNPSEDVIRASLSLELLHKFLLIHDDIIDNDRIRYGKLNLFGQYENDYLRKYAGKDSCAERYGIATSMISGDLGHSFAYEIVARTALNDSLKISLIKHLGQIIEVTACGWRVEYENMHKNIRNVTSNQVIANLKLVTSNYTTEGPMLFGALLAETADQNDIERIKGFCAPLGVAFQIKDDLMGTFSDAKTSGQEALSDIRAGKKTIQLIEAYKRSSEKDKAYLEKTIGKKTADVKDLERIRKICDKTGAHDYTLKLARKLVDESLESLNKLEHDNNYKEVLKQLAQFVIDREK